MRVTAVHRFPNGSTEDTTQQTTFEYDANSVAPGFSQNISGRLAVAKSYAATVTGGVSVTSTFYEMYSYDSAGRVLKKRLRIVNPQLGTVDKDIEYNFTAAKLNTVKYPDVNVPFTYYYDNMLRPNRMTGKDPNDFQSGTNVVDYVNSVNYNVASRMTSMWALNIGTSTYTYNERFELTRQQTGSLADIQYEYSATADNGQILSRTNNIAAEKVAYQYDSLKRLISASATNTSTNSTNWASTYGHDGWGDLLAKTPTAGSAPSLSVTVSGLTNRINSGGYTYDNNGNMTSSGTFDVDNRLTTSSGESYGYLTNNQRVYKRDASGNEWIYFHDASGKRIMTFQMQNSGGTLVVAGGSKNVYFAGKAISLDGAAVVTDRLGSVLSRAGAAVDYFTYGEEKTVTANPAEKFATYLRDATGLDYANQRYFASTAGRFLSSDPYAGSATSSAPGSWNKYSYVAGDPVNSIDPTGLFYTGVCGDNNNILCDADDGAGWAGGKVCILDGIETHCGIVGAMAQGGAAMTPANYQAWLYAQWDQAELAELVQAARNAGLNGVAVELCNLGPNPNYRQVLDAMIRGLDLAGYINSSDMKWTGTGYIINSNGLQALASFLKDSAAFGSGGLGIMHWGDTGFFSMDFRSYTNDESPFSLQVTIGSRGWIDIDQFNSYQSIGSFLKHASDEVFGKSGPIYTLPRTPPVVQPVLPLPNAPSGVI